MSVEGKNGLKSVCNSCGKSNTHDSGHKAGKALVAHLKKDGGIKGDIVDEDKKNLLDPGVDEAIDKTVEKKRKDKKKDKKAKKDEEDKVEEAGQDDLDDVSDLGAELTWSSRRCTNIIKQLSKMVSQNPEVSNDELLEYLYDYQTKYQLPNDFLHFCALCGVFPAERNIVRNWKKNEEVFVALVKLEGKRGIEHFLQSIVLYFIRKYNAQMAKYAATFVKKLVDENVLDEPFIIAWYDKERRLDKESGLYDKKAEKKFRELIEDYVENWLKKEDSDSSDDSSSSGKDNGKPASSKVEENKSAPQ